MKKGVIVLLSLLIYITSFLVPVYADSYDTFAMQPYSYSAYNYWFKKGYNQIYDTSLTEGSYYGITLNTSGTESGTIGKETSTLTGCLNVPAGSQNNTTYNITTGCSFNSTGPMYGESSARNVSYTTSEQSVGGATTTSKIYYNYKLPWLSGNYSHVTSYDDTNSIFIGHSKFYMIFYADRSIYSNPTVNVYKQNNVDINIENNSTPIGYNFVIYRFVFNTVGINDTVRISLDFPGMNSNTHIIPIYLGDGYGLDDNTKSAYNINTNLENTITDQFVNQNVILNESNNLVSNGNNTSQAAGSLVNDTNNNLSSGVSDLEGFESQFNSDLNISLSDITLPSVNGIAKFGNAARWVSTQFTRLVTPQEIQFPLIFCLSLGLALTLLGRIRS